MSDITLLDGSIGQELVNRTGVKDTPLWSTRTLIDHPEYVRDVHDSYFAAGCLIATANSYALLPDRLARFDLADRLGQLITAALAAASASRDAHGAGYVAGAMGPLSASYVPDTETSVEKVAETYASVARHHKDHADIILLETIASISHAIGGVMGARIAGKPVWLGVTLDDRDGTRLRSGESIADLLAALKKEPPDALLLNCSLPEAISTGMPLTEAPLPRGAYANGFTEIVEEFLSIHQKTEDLAPRRDLGPEAYADFALAWAKDGATILGGCCEIGPAHMRHLKDRLTAEGHTLATSLPT